MNNKKALSIKETFDLAIQKHQNNNLQDAQSYYQKVLELDPNYVDAHYNLGNIFNSQGEYQKAKDCFEKAIETDPNNANAHNNLGVVFEALSEYQKAKDCYEKAIEINPNYSSGHYNLGNIFNSQGEYQKAKDCFEKVIEIDPNNAKAHNNLGVIFKELRQYQKAKDCYEKAIEINPNYAKAHNNLGVIFQELGEDQKAKDCYGKAIKINPDYVDAYNNLGGMLQELGEIQKAKDCFEKAIKINPNHTVSYWNSHSLASSMDEALSILKKLYKIDNKYTKAKITISALECYKGNFDKINEIFNSSESNHPHARSVRWVLSLPKLPSVFFNRYSFFDAVIALTDNSRPFYEFGVWKGISFRYLINTFKKGFGFDTFTGLPEEWHNVPKGQYSAFGEVPKINGGEFIVGKFEDTLPKFFSKKKPIASLINFDADLYSSTLCALNHSNKVIDEKTILVFDEFIINNRWEEDEFKALNEFCDNLGFSYEVIAISFFTKQVAVRLNKLERVL